MGTIRGSVRLIAKSLRLLLKALPLNVALILLSILTFWVVLEVTWAYLLPVNRPVSAVNYFSRRMDSSRMSL